MRKIILSSLLVFALVLMGQNTSIKRQVKKPFQKEVSVELDNYIVKMNLIKNKKWEELPINERKNLASKLFISSSKNPLEVSELIMEKPELNLGVPGRIFLTMDDNKHNNLLFNVYVGSLIFVGEVTSIEIIRKDQIIGGRE